MTEMTVPWPMPAAHGDVLGAGFMRVNSDDFFVEEIASWEAFGSGEHDVLWIEKRDANTAWVAEQLAAYAGIRPRDVSYAGMKDRHAQTRQWFSVWRPGREIDWREFSAEGVRVLKVEAHNRKLRRGSLKGNQFRLIIRPTSTMSVDASEAACDFSAADFSAQLAQRIERIKQDGVPNYFGPQRFGRDGANLGLAQRLVNGGRLKRAGRGFALSAARSYMFNHYLAERVREGSWASAIDGDVLMLDGSHSWFRAEHGDDSIAERLHSQDVHVTGPMLGRGELGTSGAAKVRESALRDSNQGLCDALERAGADLQRRSLRARVSELRVERVDDTLVFCFSLPAGSYATALLAEILSVSDAHAGRQAPVT